MVAKRIRSPNYPSLPLDEAIDVVRKLHSFNRTNVLDRAAAAKDIGYTGLTGRSAKVLATLSQYGLLDKAGKAGVRVSPLGVKLLHPRNEGEFRESMAEAAFLPSLFAELREQFPDGVPSENALRSYLMRVGFANVAVGPAISSFLETCHALEKVGAFESYGPSGPERPKYLDEDEPQPRQSTEVGFPRLPVPQSVDPAPINRSEGVRTMDGERIVFVDETAPDRYLKVVAKGEMDSDLLEALEDFIKRQRKRLLPRSE